METLQSISKKQLIELESNTRYDLKNNYIPDDVTKVKRIAWAVWGGLNERASLSFKYINELEKYYIDLCTRIEIGELNDSQLEGCLNVLKLKYLRYLEYSKK